MAFYLLLNYLQILLIENDMLAISGDSVLSSTSTVSYNSFLMPIACSNHTQPMFIWLYHPYNMLISSKVQKGKQSEILIHSVV